jgi:penicillin amidase
LEQRPAHLLNPAFESYDALLAAAADAVVAKRRSLDGGAAVKPGTWGERNRVHIQHPIAQGVPRLSRWLDLPPESLPGDNNMPRVQSPRAGASERLVVSPGHEAEGLFHMPGGQCGHFLSPYYRAGHRDWAEGRPSPLLPGPARHELCLRPTPGGSRSLAGE